MSAAPPVSNDGQGGLVELSSGHSMSLQTARMMNVSLQRRLHDKVHRIELQHQKTRLARNIQTRDLKDLLNAIKSQPLEYLEPQNNPRAKQGKGENGSQRVSAQNSGQRPQIPRLLQTADQSNPTELKPPDKTLPIRWRNVAERTPRLVANGMSLSSMEPTKNPEKSIADKPTVSQPLLPGLFPGRPTNNSQRLSPTRSANEPVRSASVSNMYIKTPSPGGTSQPVPTLSFIQLASQMKAFSLPNLRRKQPVNNNDKPSQIAMATKLTRKQRCASYSIGMEGEGPASPAPLRLPSLANDTKWSLSLRR
ncbi:PREDICTED: uncharacterized protein LOC109486323 [Branchiostoma belcheri]|uniref:Uncharacterized protein LOC109486323 n=1 Tax=Branchiostoma belcheri TaxID=7741 RepID=A0A6P4ZWZ6_BRABE|nr:PREDICTED: uncharacterized protein LOC109486323 [Branchiostoma belcheri]